MRATELRRELETMIFGHSRLHGWWRWLPLYVSPVFEDRRYPFRTARGVAVGTFGRYCYAVRVTD
ncbi:hypothetical protein [Micromonospora sp. WMMD1082]|uniref:hypothetical protein n=1 Tax=Micromonospora sp. WMMD1082 TaxID=3016104 RepID=UPI00241748DD|nr:hypothetical protein [Micromonospora sp. WMMD1082]MDG4792688.1 hypothetical protein [Micromonospora sp. WMMD1082]